MNYDQLRLKIQNSIKGNASREITGFLLQDVLLSIVDILGADIISTGEDISVMAHWYLDDEGNICTDKQVIIKNNLIVSGDTSSGGEGQDTPSAGLNEEQLQAYLDKHKYVTEDDIAGLIPDVGLSDYYTKGQTDSAINTAIAGLINGAPTTLDTLKEIADVLAENEDVVDALEAAIGTKVNASDVYTKSQIDTKVTAINTSISSLSGRVTTLETWKTELSKYITIEDGNVKISTNLIVTGDTSSGGSGEDTDAEGTVTGIKVNGKLYEPTAGIVTIPDYPTSLTWDAISGKPTTLQGYGITDAYTKTAVDTKVTAINTSISSLSGRVTTLETWKTELSKYITIEDGNVKISTNLIVTGDTSSGGSGEDTDAETGLVTGIEVNGSLYAPVNGVVTIPNYPTSLTWDAISGKPSFAAVATSGKYSDLSGTPTIPTSLASPYALTINNSAGTAQVTYNGSTAKSLTLTKAMVGLGSVTNLAASGYLTALSSNSTNAVSITVGGTTKAITVATMKSSLGLAAVATSGKYSDLSGTPTIPTSLASPYALTINNSAGTAQVTYNGSTAKSLTLTKAMVGLGSVTNLAASGYLTALSSNSTNAVSITVGGTTKAITVATMKSSLGLAAVATSGKYSDLSGTPTVPLMTPFALPEINGATVNVPNGIHVAYLTENMTLNFVNVRPSATDHPCIISIVKAASVILAVPVLANSGCLVTTAAGAASSTPLSLGALKGVTLVWNVRKFYWECIIHGA